jgi:hypothetical protein
VIRLKTSMLLISVILLYGAAPRLDAQELSAKNTEWRGTTSDVASLPDAPAPAKATPTPAAMPQMQTHKNFDFLKKPLTSSGKFMWGMRDTLFYSVPGSAVAAGISMATNDSLENGYDDGGDGYATRFGAILAETGTAHIIGDWALASMLHQDPRYHPSEHKGFGKRLGWALSRVFVTQKDNGEHTFNSSRLFGIAAGAAAANGWHHDVNRGGPETAQRFGFAVLGDFVSKLISEFWEYRKYPRQ